MMSDFALATFVQAGELSLGTPSEPTGVKFRFVQVPVPLGPVHTCGGAALFEFCIRGTIPLEKDCAKALPEKITMGAPYTAPERERTRVNAIDAKYMMMKIKLKRRCEEVKKRAGEVRNE